MNTQHTHRPVNLGVAVPVIMQIAITAQIIWGALAKAWATSWLSSYVGVIVCLELMFYNTAIKKGEHPIKSLYPIIIMNVFAFLFTVGFTVNNGWKFSWCGMVCAIIAILIILPIDKKISKNQ